jgi:hypothetical protein
MGAVMDPQFMQRKPSYIHAETSIAVLKKGSQPSALRNVRISWCPLGWALALMTLS